LPTQPLPGTTYSSTGRLCRLARAARPTTRRRGKRIRTLSTWSTTLRICGPMAVDAPARAKSLVRECVQRGVCAFASARHPIEACTSAVWTHIHDPVNTRLFNGVCDGWPRTCAHSGTAMTIMAAVNRKGPLMKRFPPFPGPFSLHEKMLMNNRRGTCLKQLGIMVGYGALADFSSEADLGGNTGGSTRTHHRHAFTRTVANYTRLCTRRLKQKRACSAHRSRLCAVRDAPNPVSGCRCFAVRGLQ